MSHPDPPWTAQFDVSLERAQAAVAAALPQLDPARMRPFAEGWDNAMFELDGWVLRFPRRHIAVPLLGRERLALPWLAPRLPLRVPLPELFGEPGEHAPAGFFGYRLLNGVGADRGQPAPDDRAPVARELGEFLGVLHALEPDAARAAGLEDGRHAADLEDRLPRTRQAVARLAGRGEGEHAARLGGLLEATVERALRQPPGEPRVVHGDLHPCNLLVTPDGARVSGVVDWGDVAIDDPAADLGLVQYWLPAAARDEFERAYTRRRPAPGPGARERARALGLIKWIHLFDWALDSGRAALAAEARAAIERVEEGVSD